MRDYEIVGLYMDGDTAVTRETLRFLKVQVTIKVFNYIV